MKQLLRTIIRYIEKFEAMSDEKQIIQLRKLAKLFPNVRVYVKGEEV